MTSLSVCIPTYNRADFIAATLDSIQSQLGPEDEIVIVDGGSTDGTAEIVAPYAAHDARIRYLRQESNAGVDRDMDRSVRSARGPYCWLMSSDDFLLPGAIERVRSSLATEPDFVIANAEIRNFDMSRILRERVLLTRTDETFSPADRDAFFRAVAGYLSFMGGVVIRRDVWIERVHDLMYGTEFIHLHVVLERGIGREAKVISDPLIAIRYGNFTWAPRMFEISMFKWPDTIWSLPGYSDATKRAVCPRAGWRDLPRLLYHRSLGGFSLAQARMYVSRKRPGPLLRTMVRAIAFAPTGPLNLLAILFYSRRPGGGDTVYLLRTSSAYWRGSQ